MLPELFHNVMQAPAGRDHSIQWAPLCGGNAEKIDTSIFVDLEFWKVLIFLTDSRL